MGVNHGGHIFVAKQFLNGANIIAVLEQMRSKTVAKGMAVPGFWDFAMKQFWGRSGGRAIIGI
jgi:hypothetical protein